MTTSRDATSALTSDRSSAHSPAVTVLHVGGPTLVIDVAGLRILTDPTFSPVGPHPLGDIDLIKLTGPAVPAADLGQVDLVLLSHDQHPDNLDAGGREVIATAGRTLSTPEAAARVERVEGLAPWQETKVATPHGAMTVTAVPARHGPPGAEDFSGTVTGFVLEPPTAAPIYVSGDNASVALVEQIAARFRRIGVAVLFCGAARAPEMPEPLTLTAEDAVIAARALAPRVVVPVHADGWLHFTESTGSVSRAFRDAGLSDLLAVPVAGIPRPVYP